MSPEGKPQSSPLGFSPIREDLPLSRRDLDSSDEPEENRACTSVQTRAESGPENFNRGKSPFLKVLIEAEAASSAAAIQLVAFKDAVDNEFASSGKSTKDKSKITRQKGLLLEKLEEFRRLNKSVRQKLKQLQDAEAYRIDADRKMETLLKWIRNTESENENLKKNLDETEKRISKLMDLRKDEQENIKSLVHTTKSIETTRAHLQGQLRNKEAENNRLTVHLRTLERTVAEQKSEIDQLKTSFASLTKKAVKDKEYLRKATQAQKLRAERFEAAIEKCNAQLKERMSVAHLKEQLADCESALVEEKTISLEKKNEAEQCHFQVSGLKAEIDSLQIKYANLLRETRTTQDEKETEVEKVNQELQGRIEELRVYPELLGEAKQSLLQCQENLRRLERQCLEKSESVKQLQFKMETQNKQLRSSLEMKESVHEANLKVQEKVNSLQRKIDQMQQENLELVRKLAAQDEALSYSNRQLDQRSSECQALNRQLEAALSDVREQVSKVKTQTSSREEALQKKILQLQAEQSRRNNELKLLRESKQNAEKQFEVRLRNLELSLDQSESHKRSIQNYVDFLKKSYMAIFDEGVQTSTFGSSYFLK
ncbi:outer dense fiber protein 2-like isoform X3 [Poeciliopsis prolifica]|uniref:outer dense fiber protein 2-like isoform X3 n=1 Tax=Poeciliopsis prolifica TaxID=188132 RepID=UPI002412FF81|nr:outer dense fiber protein 2-like isoform X3 [Poeciliopsis prolifica]